MAKTFPEKVVKKALLWCGRHCCVCGKQCGLHIETHHIDPEGPGDLDNCLPVCYDCHGQLSHYDPKQPRGRKYSQQELKNRREQIYEMHTQSLVPPTEFRVATDPRGLPYARFHAMNLGNYPPVKARITISPYVDGKKGKIIQGLHYDGKIPANLNPRHGFDGWFALPRKCMAYKHRLMVVVHVTIIDPYERPHALLPFGFVHMKDAGDGKPGWYYEPSPEDPRIIEGS